MSENFHLYTGYTRNSNYREFSIKAVKGELSKEILQESLYTATIPLKKVQDLYSKGPAFFVCF